jgi:hypothetical protein
LTNDGFTRFVSLHDCLDQVLTLGDECPNPGEEQHAAVVKAFDELAKQIRLIKDFPLQILSIQGIDPVFRGCEVGCMS